MQDELKRLKDELYLARRDLVEIATNSLSEELYYELLSGSHKCNTMDEFFVWKHNTIKKIVEASKPEQDEDIYRPLQVYCPFCKNGTTWGDVTRGFAWPAGLSMHLNGDGNARQCRVIKAAFELGRERVDEKIEKRRKTERVFVTVPGYYLPNLIEECWGGEPRTAEQLEQAEARLQALGLEPDIKGNVVAYWLKHPDFLVLADPRALGKIKFNAFSKRRQYKGRDHKQLASLTLEDDRKINLDDLTKELEAAVAAAKETS
jgi:hypothetical protein